MDSVKTPDPAISEFAPPGVRVQLDGRGDIWIRQVPGRESGRPVLLLHGLGATAGLNWAGAFRALDPRLRVIGVDHRGHGRGIRTDRFSLEDCADDVAALIRKLKLDQPMVVGYSMGGPIATLLWQRHPELVGSLVLCATAAGFGGTAARRMAYQWTEGMALLPAIAVPFGQKYIGRALDRLTPTEFRSARMARWTLRELSGHEPRSIWQAASCLGTFDSAPWLPGIDVPTTVIATTRDRLVPFEDQIRMARSIPHADFVEVPAGHLWVAGRGQTEFMSALDLACHEMFDLAAA